jgi:hypothetical protein
MMNALLMGLPSLGLALGQPFSVITTAMTKTEGNFFGAAAVGTNLYFPPYQMAQIGVFDTSTNASRLIATTGVTATSYSHLSVYRLDVFSARCRYMTWYIYVFTPLVPLHSLLRVVPMGIGSSRSFSLHGI